MILARERVNLGLDNTTDSEQMDIVEYLNTNFATVDTLGNIDSLIVDLDKQIKATDE